MPILTLADRIRFCNCYKVEGNFMTDGKRQQIRKEYREEIARWEKLKEKYDIKI